MTMLRTADVGGLSIPAYRTVVPVPASGTRRKLQAFREGHRR